MYHKGTLQLLRYITFRYSRRLVLVIVRLPKYKYGYKRTHGKRERQKVAEQLKTIRYSKRRYNTKLLISTSTIWYTRSSFNQQNKKED